MKNTSLVHKNIPKLIYDYIHCNINFTDLQIDNINNKLEKHIIKSTVKTMHDLEQIKLVNNVYCNLAGGFFANMIQLNPQKSAFLLEWISTGYSIYDAIILVVLMNETYSSLINKNEHKQWMDKNSILSSLNMLNDFNYAHHEGMIFMMLDMNIYSRNFQRWANKYNISSSMLTNIINDINKLSGIISSNMKNVNARAEEFDVKNLICKATPILKHIYKNDILVIKNRNIVQPHDNITYIINKDNISEIPEDEKIIPIASHHIDKLNKSNFNMKYESIDVFFTI
jgi:hypothetical protein